MSIENRINADKICVWRNKDDSMAWHDFLKNRDLTDYVISVGALSYGMYEFRCYHKSSPDCKLIIDFEC